MSAAAPSPAPHVASGLLLASAGAVAFSAKAILIKVAYRYDVDAITLLMYRMLFALPLFLALAWWASSRQDAQARLVLKRRDWLGVLGLGFTGYYLASSLDFLGLQYITASLERLILYLNPTLVLALGWVLYQRRVTGLQMLAMAVSYVGVLLVFGHEVGFQGPDAALGALLVFGSAVTYAVYLVYSGEMVKRLGSLRLVSLSSIVACVLCLLQFLVLRPLDAALVVPEVIWLSLLNALLCTVAPMVMVMMAIERIGAGLTAQTGMIGPMSTIILGVLILDEPFNSWVLAGTTLVVLGVFLVTRFGGLAARK